VLLIEYLPDSPAYGVLELGHGLWRVPLDGTGAVQLTNDSMGWSYVSNGEAWANSRSLNIAGAPDDILRFDLQTRQLTTWFSPGKRTAVLAIDSSGVPVISSEAGTYEVWRVAAAESGVKIWSGPSNDLVPGGPVAVDGGAMWFSAWSLASGSGIYRYSQSKGMELVAKFSDRTVWVAGPCG